jgi:hypothetical protein
MSKKDIKAWRGKSSKEMQWWDVGLYNKDGGLNGVLWAFRW